MGSKSSRGVGRGAENGLTLWWVCSLCPPIFDKGEFYCDTNLGLTANKPAFSGEA